MRIELIAILLTLGLGQMHCWLPKFLPSTKSLPSPRDVKISPHGASIELRMKRDLLPRVVRGELIAVDVAAITVLMSKPTMNVVKVPWDDVGKYYVLYARPAQYFWAYRVSGLLPLIPIPHQDPYPGDNLTMMPLHGWYFLFTVPANLAVVTLVNVAALNEFRYNMKQLKPHELQKFARFPQGVPEGLDLRSLK